MHPTLRPGFKFRDGKLMIFTGQETRLISSWPELQAVRKLSPRKLWTGFVPTCRLLRPKSGSSNDDSLGPERVQSVALDPAYEKHLAFTQFRHSIPPDIARTVERFTSRQWLLLALCQRRERVSDLLEQNPALGFGVAHLHKFRLREWDHLATAVRVSACRQRDMLGWLGFPKTQSWANILAKIPAAAVSVELLKILSRAAAYPGTEIQLQRLRSINAGVIGLLAHPRNVIMTSQELLAEVAESPAELTTPGAAQLLEHFIRLHDRLPEAGFEGPFRKIEEVRSRLQELLELEERLHRQKQEQVRLSKLLPPPPLPGSEEIVPLTHADDLSMEGRSQHNCVSDYVARVQSGGIYIYRVLAPQRATLSIVWGADGNWVIGELLGACNQPVSPLTHQAVQSWLNQYSSSV